jgi:hypothetical protein
MRLAYTTWIQVRNMKKMAWQLEGVHKPENELG